MQPSKAVDIVPASIPEAEQGDERLAHGNIHPPMRIIHSTDQQESPTNVAG